MPKLTIYPSGIKAAKPPRKITHRGRRNQVRGWSKACARRCGLFLRSVDIDALLSRSLYGIAATLTVRDCPPTHAEWAALQRAFFERLTRRKLVLAHFVTEWQVRARYGVGPVPHLHTVLFFPTFYDVQSGHGLGAEYGPSAVGAHWVDLAARYGAIWEAQHCEAVTDVQGWFRYLAKHAARSVDHYQRDPDLIPNGWKKTGRMWGHRGDWPVQELNAQLSDRAFYALRRMANRYQRAKARALVELNSQRLADARGRMQKEDGERLLAMSRNRVHFLRKQLQRNRERIGRILPRSEWVPADIVRRWLNGTCEDVTSTHPETGEITPYYILSDEADPNRRTLQLHRELMAQR